MVLIMNTNNDIKTHTQGYQNCNTSQILVFGEYVKMRKSLYTQVIIWVDNILNHLDTRALLPRYQDSCMVYRPEWYQK